MRSRTELQALAARNGVDSEGLSREEIMDALREKLGTFDPELQIDPAKAKDLKSLVAFGSSDPFAGLEKEGYLTEQWALEPKLDGARMRVFLGTSQNTMNTGRRSDVTFAYTERADNFPHLRDATVPELAGTILDGELMPPSRSLTTVSGVTTVGTLNSAMALVNVNPAASVITQEKHGKAIFVAFDVLAYQGESTVGAKGMTYAQRRELLEKIVGQLKALEPAFQITKSMAATKECLEACFKAGFEGGMLKRRDSLYFPGKRMSTWGKVKKMSTGDFFIIGSVDGKGRNTGKVGSLKVAYRGEDGQPVYCADVAGFTDAFRDELTGEDGKVARSFIGTVIEVAAQGRTKGHRLRHPLYVRTRTDKVWTDCGPEQLFDCFEEV